MAKRFFHPVHLIWDIESVRVPFGSTPAQTTAYLYTLIQRDCCGKAASFYCICRASSLDPATKRDLQDANVIVDEIHATSATVQTRLLTRLLNTVLLVQQDKEHQHRSILIFISNNRDFAPALSLVRRHGIFQQTILIYQDPVEENLKLSVDKTYEWNSGFIPAAPPTTLSKTHRTERPWRLETPLPPVTEAKPKEVAKEMAKVVAPVPLPSPPEVKMEKKEIKKSYLDVAILPTVLSSSASASSTSGSSPPLVVVKPQPKASTPLPEKVEEARKIFRHVMKVCEDEQIIPRESVLQSKLEDSNTEVLPSGVRPWGQLRTSFDEWVHLLVRHKICACVGAVPQRVLWEMDRPRFPCADYFRPEERLSIAEMTELMQFLHKEQQPTKPKPLIQQARAKTSTTTKKGKQGDLAEADRGRYGFAHYLMKNGPPFVRSMPRGHVVELVQLLLNRHFLLFRQGRVSLRYGFLFPFFFLFLFVCAIGRQHWRDGQILQAEKKEKRARTMRQRMLACMMRVICWRIVVVRN